MSLRRTGSDFTLDFAPFRLSGTVYGVLLNHGPAYDALQPKMDAAPYKAAPRAPVLYIKPATCLAADGDNITLPQDSTDVEIGASIGLIIGRTACRVSERNAMEHVAGLLIVNDVSVPHAEFFRPSVRYKARDGYCPIGAAVSLAAAPALQTLTLQVTIAETPTQRFACADLRRSAPRLLADVTEFMTLTPGDILMLGAMWPLPRARAGQRVTVHADGLGTLINTVVAGTA